VLLATVRKESVWRMLSLANQEFNKMLHIARDDPLLQDPLHVPTGSGRKMTFTNLSLS
jgi:hypothetical protein